MMTNGLKRKRDSYSFERTERFLTRLKYCNPDHQLKELTGCNQTFKDILSSEGTLSFETISLVLSVTASASTGTNRYLCYDFVVSVLYCKQFMLVHLQQYLASVIQEHLPRKHVQPISDLVNFLTVAVNIAAALCRSKLVTVLPVLKVITLQFNLKGLLSSEVIQGVEHLSNIVEQFYVSKKTFNGDRPETIPPDDFRMIPVTPDINDILSNSVPFLRSNIVFGPYKDVDHYLDVQFRLLREDFVRPLRDGINKYLCMKELERERYWYKDVRIYTNVHIVQTVCTRGDLLHEIHFDTTPFKHIRWETSKRLLTGNLLCFSSDNFNTIALGTVAARKAEELSKGKCLILFHDVHLNPEESFVMIETISYFEAYKHSLATLQQITSDNFSLKDYIIEVKQTSKKPSYMNNETVYDVASLLKIGNLLDESADSNVFSGEQKGYDELSHDSTDSTLLCSDSPSFPCKEPLCKVKILNKTDWPDASQCMLDESQYMAVKAALTEEFTIIQGPPGTGKTFIGLKIVEILLANTHVWYDGSPILVVCYTNHALDQFLEGLSKITSKIVRVGGRMKSKAIECFNISKIRTQKAKVDYVPKITRKAFYRASLEKDRIHKNLTQTCSSVLKLNERLMTCEELQLVARPGHMNGLVDCRGQAHLIKEWLFPEASLIPNYRFFSRREDAKNVAQNIMEEDDQSDISDFEDIQGLREVDDDFYLPNESLEINCNFALYDEQDAVYEEMPEEIRLYLKDMLSIDEVMSAEETDMIQNVWVLPLEERWRLYRFWIRQLKTQRSRKLIQLQNELNKIQREINQIRDEEDYLLLKNTFVVGMTTTGAAKYHALVQKLKSPIVIIEEAAEVFEAHVVTSLTSDTKHLILIGDHVQLRPKPNVYELARKFKLDVSLFERMIINKFKCYQLTTQHRMRPEFVKLLVPQFYQFLDSHSSVKEYPSMKGITKNLYFINHGFQEQSISDDRGHCNQHEANFLGALCQYILLQNYKPNQITILTTYAQQVHIIKQKLKTYSIVDVRVTTVDNFQGEENDIILLSFVRSNREENIGFLKVKNRVCVALSRARMGMYCIGNFKLMSKLSDLWRLVVDELQEQNALGEKLELQCQNHAKKKTLVYHSDDFKVVPEGGCNLPCKFRLNCGHQCPRVCHIYDKLHKTVKCMEKCSCIICRSNHECPLRCHVPCKPCAVKIAKIIPQCKHEVEIPCSQEPETFKCDQKCEKSLPCGHRCLALCGDSCTDKCSEKIKVTAPCGHDLSVFCFQSGNMKAQLNKCKKPCGHLLPNCGHRCTGTCGKCSQGRLHIKCKEKCDRILVCGHKCSEPCSRNCPPCERKCENKCNHSKCPRLCGEVCIPCKMACAWRRCRHRRCRKRCYQECNVIPCYMPCPRKLKCGHSCIGFCGEPCPNKCGICNTEEVHTLFFGTEDDVNARFVMLEDCKHIFEASALDKWMAQEDAGDQGREIQMKACPLCKTLIRRTRRYQHIIQRQLRDVESVKEKYFGNRREVLQQKKQLKAKFLRLKAPEELTRLLELFIRKLTSNDTLSKDKLQILENGADIIDKLHFLHTKLCVPLSISAQAKLKMPKVLVPVIAMEKLQLMWESLFSFIRNILCVASRQQFEDISWEILRFSYLQTFLEIMEDANSNSETLILCKDIMEDLSSLYPFCKESEGKVKEKLDRLRKMNGCVIGVTHEEKRLILKAMKLEQGHYFRCPNGHVYAITECGGAVSRGICNECRASIGGTSYRLNAGNRLAREMDGASRSAYPADMEQH